MGWLWSAADRCNPGAALRKALRRARIAGDLHCWRSGRETLERPLFAEAQVREAWLQRAQCRCDMAKVAAGRPKLRLGEQAIQWGWIHGQVAKVHLSADRLAALIGVMAGDAVPELTAMKWQKKSTGLCSCGEPEDLHHRWWRCPRRHALRLQALRGAKPAALAALPQCTVLYGIPVELPAVARWREGLPPDAPVQMPSSRRYYPDGSCLRPRLPEVRVAAWAVVGCVNGVWWHRAGPCPGEQTIGRAELAAIVQILNGAEPGVILTDCEGVQRKCASIQCGSITREELGKGTNADLWARAWEPLRGPQGWTVQWLPSHRSLPEALAAGVSQEDWHGNDLADAAAKEEARRHDLPAEVLEQWADRQAANEAVWRLIAESQVAHLSARPRRHDGAAAKARKRKAPARPNRRVRPRAVAAAVEPAPAQLPQSVLAKAAAAAEAAAAAARHAMAVAAARVPAVLQQQAAPAVAPAAAPPGLHGTTLSAQRKGGAVAPPLRAQVQHLQLELLRAYPKLVHHEWGYLKAVSRCPRVCRRPRQLHRKKPCISRHWPRTMRRHQLHRLHLQRRQLQLRPGCSRRQRHRHLSGRTSR